MPSTTSDLDEIGEALVKVALKEGWQYKYAKFGRGGKSTQSLFVHSVNAFSLARILGPNLFDCSPEDVLIASVAAFFHDYQKAEKRWQDAAVRFMHGHAVASRDFDHDLSTPEVSERLEKLLGEVDSLVGTSLADESKRILRIIIYTHDAVNSAAALKRKQEVGSLDPLTRVIRLCDSIASIKTAKDIKKKAGDPDIPTKKSVEFEYHSVSVIRGVISSFLNEAATELMEKIGYTPLLHFGSSTAYIRIGQNTSVDNPKQYLKDLIIQQFRKFQDSDIYERGMIKGVVGPLPQKKWPLIHLVREKDIEPILRDISSQPLANKDTAFGEQYIAESAEKDKDKGNTANVDAIERFFALTKSTSKEAIIATMVSDFNLLIYVADFVKNYREFAIDKDRAEDYDRIVNGWLQEHLGSFVVDDMKGIDHRTPASQRVEVVEKLWHLGTKDLHKLSNRREIILEESVLLLKKIIEHFGELSPKLIEDEVLAELIGDIEYIPINLSSDADIRRIAHETLSVYRAGKMSSDRLCNLCSLSSVETAPAGLFGAGSEMFSNTIAAGVALGGTRKAQVCSLCVLEGTIRAFYFGSPPSVTVFVFPDLSLSPEGFKLWSNAISDTVRTEHVGFGIGRSWNMIRVYEHLSKGGTIDSSSQLVVLLRPTKNEINGLAEYLSQERERPEDVDYEVQEGDVESITYDNLAKAHLNHEIVIDPYLIEGYAPKYMSQRSSCFTASHAISFLRDVPREDKDESPSSSALRLQLMAIILSDVFHARVVAVEGYQPYIQSDMEGMVQVEMPAPAENALKSLGLSRTALLHEIRQAQRRLSSLVRIGMTFTKGLGKDRLLRLSSMNRGAILRRVEIDDGKKMKSWDKRLLLDLLENMPAKAGES